MAGRIRIAVLPPDLQAWVSTFPPFSNQAPKPPYPPSVVFCPDLGKQFLQASICWIRRPLVTVSTK